MSPAEAALRTALHNDARSHIGAMFGIAPVTRTPPATPRPPVAPIVPVNAALPLKG